MFYWPGFNQKCCLYNVSLFSLVENEQNGSEYNKLIFNEIKVCMFLPSVELPEHKSLLKPQYPATKLKCQISSLSLHSR